jgi:hypothetical protein
VINQRKNELIAQRDDLENEALRIQDELNTAVISPEEESKLLEFADQIRARLVDPTFDQKRRVLESIDLRIDVLSRDRIKLCGAITDGLIVDLSCTYNHLYLSNKFLSKTENAPVCRPQRADIVTIHQ